MRAAFYWPTREIDLLQSSADAAPIQIHGPRYATADDAIRALLEDGSRIAQHPQLCVVVARCWDDGARIERVLSLEYAIAGTLRRPNRGAPAETRRTPEQVRELLDEVGLDRRDVCRREAKPPDRTKPAARVPIPPVSASALELDTRRSAPDATDEEIALVVARRLMYPQREVALLRSADGSPVVLTAASLERGLLDQSKRPEMQEARLVAIWPALTPKGQTPEALAALRARLAYTGETLDEVELHVAPMASGRTTQIQLGATTEIVVPTGSGMRRYAARYAIMPGADVITSHDPQSFRPDPRYPAGLQERDYTQREEREKVVRQATAFVPSLVLNSNPDATNGPPIVTQEGLVVGGNSRAMTIKRARSAYEAALGPAIAEHCGTFGLRGAELPEGAMLVRILVDEFNPRTISNELNRVPMQQIGEAAGAVSLAARLPESVLLVVTDTDAAESGTLRGALRAQERLVVAELQRSDIITPQNRALWLRKDGALTDEAFTQIERGIVGALVPDKTLLSRVQDVRSLYNLLLAAAPAFVSLERLDPESERGYNVAPSLRAAIPIVLRLIAMRPHERAEYWLAQGIIEDEPLERVVSDPVAVEAVLWLLDAVKTPRKAAADARNYLDRARQAADVGQALLLAPPDPPELRRETLGWWTPAMIEARGGALSRLSGQRLENPTRCACGRVLAVHGTPSSRARAASVLGLERLPRGPWRADRVGIVPLDGGAIALVEPLRRRPNGVLEYVVPVARLISGMGIFMAGLDNPTPQRRPNGRPCAIMRLARLITGTWVSLGAVKAIQDVSP